MNIIRHKYIFLVFSGILVCASIIALLVWGLRPGIDFTGGSLLEVEFAAGKRPDTEEIARGLQSVGLDGALVQPAGERAIIIRAPRMDESARQRVLARMTEFVSTGQNSGSEVLERRFEDVGPTLGRELRRRSVAALGIASAAIVLYIAWAFRQVSRPVPSWKYGLVAVAALIHDVIIPAGVFAVLGHFRGVEVDALFVSALLTIMGFSVHDTIVVFDRIRENLQREKSPEHFAATVNRSITQTLARSVNTSLTVLVVLATIFFVGGATTRWFALSLIIGITAGTYSSIFVASPLVVVWNDLTRNKG